MLGSGSGLAPGRAARLGAGAPGTACWGHVQGWRLGGRAPGRRRAWNGMLGSGLGLAPGRARAWAQARLERHAGVRFRAGAWAGRAPGRRRAWNGMLGSGSGLAPGRARAWAQARLERPAGAGPQVVVALHVVLEGGRGVHAQRAARVHQQHARQRPRAVPQRACRRGGPVSRPSPARPVAGSNPGSSGAPRAPQAASAARSQACMHPQRVLSPALPQQSGLRERKRLRALRLPVRCKAGRAVKQGRSRRATASLSSARSRLSLFGGRLAAPAPLSALAPACAARRAGSAPTAAGSAAAAAPGPPAASAGPPPAPAAGGCLRPAGDLAAAAGLSPDPSALPRPARGRASATAAGWGAAAACTAAAALGRARGCALRRERV